MNPNFTLNTPTLASQVNMVLAVARKDWKHYWRYPSNAFLTILHPLIWLTPIYFLGKAFSVDGEAVGFAGYAGTSDYMSFILLGTVLTNFINAVFWSMGYALKQDMDGGTLEANWLAPISRPLLLVGHTLTNLGITLVLSLFMLLLAALLFGFSANGDVWNALLAVLPMLIGLYGFGFAFAALVLIMRDANTMVDISSFLVQIFSGANFPVNSLPRFLLPISLALPLTYGFDALRGWLLRTKTILPLHVEMWMMAGFMVLMIGFGLWAFKKLERHVRRTGSLGAH